MKSFILLIAAFLSTSLMAQKSQTITFTKDKLVEVALLSVKEGKESQFFQEYFSQVMPVAIPYGANPIGSFAVTRKVEQNNPSEMVIFFEWGSLEEKRMFEANPEFLRLRNIRDNALEYLAQGFFEAEETVSIEVSNDKVYDFAALWLDPEEGNLLEEYFAAVMPEATKASIGYTPITTLKSLDARDQNYHPNLIAFAEWKGGPDAVDKLQRSKVFKKNVHLRETAAPYKEVMHIVPIIED